MSRSCLLCHVSNYKGFHLSASRDTRLIQNCAAPLGTRLWGVGGGHQPQPDTPLALPQPFVLKEFGNPQKKLTHTNALRLYRPSVSYPNCSCTAAALESRCCVPGRPVPACRVSIGASHAQLRLGRTGHGVRIARAPACMARSRPLRPRPDPAHLPDLPAIPIAYFVTRPPPLRFTLQEFNWQHNNFNSIHN